ncbi:collagen-like protein [Streptomyces sp. JJ66]|uniref:NUDIX hydrolase n=1 Tax=Streptomyces sp. JJ66 TaxID=2803843 RepID=UPI001C5A419D|nr:collagen-like protein [Streptomyces sp. JJ66]MBW1603812.1 collagen-like protein [Streptomyces sp. JJ66]
MASNGRGGGRRDGQWYPASWPERIRAHQRGELTPVTPKPAATVMLLRDDSADGERGPRGADGERGSRGADGARGPRVHMLRRRTSMAFAGGAYAYPGGGVDPRDEAEVRWAGPARAVWGERLGVGPAEAQAIVCAAVRETFEEAGVLLAGPDAVTVVADTTGAQWEADRRALVDRELSFADFLARRDLVLRSDLLGAWARWITPEFEERRYDTWFFVAALPSGQRTRNASSEADRAVWIAPAEAAARYDRGELTMMPPTIATLRDLTTLRRADEALARAADRDLTPVLARATLDGDEIVLSWPGHDEFEKRIFRV